MEKRKEYEQPCMELTLQEDEVITSSGLGNGEIDGGVIRPWG